MPKEEGFFLCPTALFFLKDDEKKKVILEHCFEDLKRIGQKGKSLVFKDCAFAFKKRRKQSAF